MKKYLLLAATAMLFSTNAMATTYPDLDGQTANVNVSANFIRSCSFVTSEDKVNFGTIIVTGEAGTEFEIEYNPSERPNTVSGDVDAGLINDYSVATLEYNCDNDGWDSVDIIVSCTDGGDIENGCNIGSTGYTIRPIDTVGGDHNHIRYFAGDLKGTIPSANYSFSDESALLVTLSYE